MAENGNGKAKSYAVGVWTIVGPILLTLLFLFGQGYMTDTNADIEKKADKAVVEEQIKGIKEQLVRVEKNGDKRDKKLDKIIDILIERGG